VNEASIPYEVAVALLEDSGVARAVSEAGMLLEKYRDVVKEEIFERRFKAVYIVEGGNATVISLEGANLTIKRAPLLEVLEGYQLFNEGEKYGRDDVWIVNGERIRSGRLPGEVKSFLEWLIQRVPQLGLSGDAASRAVVALKSKLESVDGHVVEASIREFYKCLRPAEDHVVETVMFYFNYGIGRNVLEAYVNAVKEAVPRLQVGERLKRRMAEVLRLEGNEERLSRYVSWLIEARSVLQKLGLNVAEVLREVNVEQRLGRVGVARALKV